MEPVAKDKILNTLQHWKRQESQQAFWVWLGDYSVPTASVQAPGTSRAASGRRRPGADGRAGQVGSVRAVPEHVGVGRLEELDVVLHAAVGALRLLQAVFQVLQPALVAAVSLRGETSVGQVCDRSRITRPRRHRDFISDCQGLTERGMGSACQWTQGLLLTIS